MSEHNEDIMREFLALRDEQNMINDIAGRAFLERTLRAKDAETKKAVEEVVRENSDKLWGEGYTAGILYERNRIEEIFEKHVPPHAMDLEDSVWLKRLLNKAFNHSENI